MSTIAGNLKQITGGAYANVPIRFEPLSTPAVIAGALTGSAQLEITSNGSGAYTTSLVAGDYRVTLNNSQQDRFLITVPDDSLTYALEAITKSSLTYTSAAPPASFASAAAIFAIMSFATRAALQASTTLVNASFAVVLAAAAEGDGGEGIYRYSSTSVTTADGTLVIKPDSITLPAPGRWHRLHLT